MKMHLDTTGNNLVTDYGIDYICVNGVRHQQSIVVSSSQTDAWQQNSVSDLQLADFAELLQQQPEIILLGTGKKHFFPKPELMTQLFAQGCALEVMNTSAACRTYNVLVGEQRKVIAVLLQATPGRTPGSQSDLN